jgi:hypothetical protein
MFDGLALVLSAVAALASPSGAAAVTRSHAQSIPLMTPLEHLSDPLKRALSSLTHAANQTCDVKAAIVDIKAALQDTAAGESFLGQHREAVALPALPPDVTPDFTPPPRPAPRRNEMLEAALKSLETTFHRVTQTTGGDWGGARDKAYHHIDEAATNLLAAIKNANAAFSHGRRGELPSCKPDA